MFHKVKQKVKPPEADGQWNKIHVEKNSFSTEKKDSDRLRFSSPQKMTTSGIGKFWKVQKGRFSKA